MTTRGGEAIIDTFKGDGGYMVQIDVKLNSGKNADIWVRYTDSNNAYRFRLDGTTIDLHLVSNGKYTSLASVAYTTATSVEVKIKVGGVTPSTLKAWVDGTLKINATDSTHAAGGVALGGDQPKFDNLKIGYDNNNDDDIDDVGDDLVVDEDFASTSLTVSHDDAGNLINDGTHSNTYDAWHRLVKVQSAADSGAVTIQTAEFDVWGRRIKKVVTNSGDLDATTVFLYDRHKIIETRDGSSNVVAQFIHGTRYIDELVMARITGKGDFYYHQDANWNVIALTNPAGGLVEEYNYTPYGRLVAKRHHAFGDADADGDVDAADNTAWLATQGQGGIYES
ncbi:MAG: hypothetical protein IIA44_08720 [Acidobacteria bacterium]|nr:hypothetical protein [Acidobacteriota bacterium]